MKTILRITLSLFAALLLFGNVAKAQVPNLTGSASGCPFTDGVGIVRCYDCWSCSSQPNNLGCYGNCATGCGTCFKAYDYTTYDKIDVYDVTGAVKATYNAKKGWTLNTITINGQQGIELIFEEYIVE